ncbi:MAG TPA: amidohydrolase family protein [Anaerolineae bacterium]|nr:amidohydrolase family protein [Anaerolineae bacterium]
MTTYQLIRNGTLIDGLGTPPQPHTSLLIADNTIKTIAPDNEITLPDAPITTIDATDQFILPGLIDTHVHLILDEIDTMKRLNTPFSLTFYQALGAMRRTLDAGITSVRDAGGADLGMKQAVSRGLVDGPRMQIAISILTITGGHADGWTVAGGDLGFFPPHPGRPHGLCDGLPEVRRKVREVLRAGADVIKICATGGVLSPTDHPEFTQFSPEELDVIVREAAYRRGVKVMAHAQGLEGIKNAIRAGIHSIEHGIYLDDEALDLMLKNGTYLVPTLLAPIAVLEIGESTGKMPEWGIRKSRETIDAHRQSIADAHKAGVKIAMGTDAGVMPHGTNLRELGLMCDIGMTPMEAIVATTHTAAQCLGWDDHLGSLQPNYHADLILTQTDPLADIRSLENNDNITLVMQDGEIKKMIN